MAKTKIADYSSTASNNTDVDGINIAEGMAPSNVNNAMREIMAHLKDWQAGNVAQDMKVDGAFTCTGAAVFSSTVVATTPSATDDSTKVATTAFVRDILPSGVIVMWSGSVASIPSGWLICDGTNGTPDLRNRFIVGAGSTYAVDATGGSADAIVVSHTHTTTVTDPGHFHAQTGHVSGSFAYSAGGGNPGVGVPYAASANTQSKTTGITVSANSTGSSGTNANLPPYYALAYIMKS